MKKILTVCTMAALGLSAQAQTVSFDDYTVGQLSPQGGWIVDAAEVGKSTIATGGLFGNATGNHLALSGSSVPAAKMNRWLAYPVTLAGATFISFEMNIAASGNTDPSELFFGFHNSAATNSAPWNSYVALKHANNGSDPIGIEGTGSGGVIANAGIVLDTDIRVGAQFDVDGLGNLNNISVWLNPTIGGDGLPTNAPDLTWAVAGTQNMAAQTLLKMRAQNMPTLIDNISIVAVPEPSTYAALLGLLALGLVAVRRRRQ